MRKRFRDLVKETMSSEAQEKAHALAQKDLAAMELAELRSQRRVSQVELAARMSTAQGSISRLERRSDWKVSTLRDYVAAIGGQLEVRAVFRDRAVVLNHVGPRRKRKRRQK